MLPSDWWLTYWFSCCFLGVRMTYKQTHEVYGWFTRRADRRLPPGCYGNLIVNVDRGQSRPKRPVHLGLTPTDTIGPHSRSRLSGRYVLVELKWRKSQSIFKARRVLSFDIVQSDSILCQPADEHNREAFACELTQETLPAEAALQGIQVNHKLLPKWTYRRKRAEIARKLIPQ